MSTLKSIHPLDGLRFDPMDNLLDTRWTNINIVPGLNWRAAWLEGHTVTRPVAEAMCERLNRYGQMIDTIRNVYRVCGGGEIGDVMDGEDIEAIESLRAILSQEDGK